MASEVLLPKQGNSVESCIIVSWKVDEGASVAKGDVLMEVETDKATMDVESTADGVLLRRLVAEGDDVPVLSPIAVVGEPGEAVDSGAGGTRAEATAQTGSAPGAPTSRGTMGTRPGAYGTVATTGTASATTNRGGAKISPRARKLAASRGVAYEGLSGSGPGGRIMVRDIEAALAEGVAVGGGSGGVGANVSAGGGAGAGGSGADATSERLTGGGVAVGEGAGGPQVDRALPTSETPIRGVRKLIAERMHESIISTAQLTMDAAADARAILAYRKRLKARDDERLASISINDLVLLAVSRVLPRFGELNATFADGVIRTFSQIDLGFAVDTPRGLMVPVIRAAELRSLVNLSQEAHRLAAACQTGRINPDELTGGTFSVTNLGAFGIERFTPVLNPPQVAILGVCAITQRHNADGEVIPMMGLSLTIDHQVVDGAPAARFLKALTQAIAEIDLTLAE